jgi:hypothetical protein
VRQRVLRVRVGHLPELLDPRVRVSHRRLSFVARLSDYKQEVHRGDAEDAEKTNHELIELSAISASPR